MIRKNPGSATARPPLAIAAEWPDCLLSRPSRPSWSQTAAEERLRRQRLIPEMDSYAKRLQKSVDEITAQRDDILSQVNSILGGGDEEAAE